jgi:hypothetical protein
VEEYSGPSEEIPVVDLSSNEEDGLPDTLWDEEFTEDFLTTSTAGFLGHPMMITVATPMKNRRCVRRTPPMSKLLHLLM